MLFQYVGSHKDSPETTSVFGYAFARNGEPVDVVNEKHIAKLSGNKSFAQVVDGKSKPKRKKAVAQEEPVKESTFPSFE